jgi:hypothetical protein
MSSTQIDSKWSLVHEELVKEMNRVRDEIRNYPAPIPACDAQFNHLLKARDALSSELARVRELMNRDACENARISVEAFLNSSTCLGDAARSEIRALIENENPNREGDP